MPAPRPPGSGESAAEARGLSDRVRMWIRQVTRLEIWEGFTDSARRGPIGSGGPRAAAAAADATDGGLCRRCCFAARL